MLAAGASERGECEKGLGAGLGTGQLAARCQPQENQKDPGQVWKPLGRRAPRRPAASTLESRHKKGPPGWEPRHHSAVTRLQGQPLPLRTLPPACTKAGDVWGTGGGVQARQSSCPSPSPGCVLLSDSPSGAGALQSSPPALADPCSWSCSAPPADPCWSALSGPRWRGAFPPAPRPQASVCRLGDSSMKTEAPA